MIWWAAAPLALVWAASATPFATRSGDVGLGRIGTAPLSFDSISSSLSSIDMTKTSTHRSDPIVTTTSTSGASIDETSTRSKSAVGGSNAISVFNGQDTDNAHNVGGGLWYQSTMKETADCVLIPTAGVRILYWLETETTAALSGPPATTVFDGTTL